MRGRYVNVVSTADLTSEFDIEETLGHDAPPSWNIAPTDLVRIVTYRRSRDAGDDAEPVRQLGTVHRRR
jgi:putative SOS response-associated peptidase YedK